MIRLFCVAARNRQSGEDFGTTRSHAQPQGEDTSQPADADHLVLAVQVGTVTQDVATAVKAVQGGQVEFRTDKSGVIHAGLGKSSFEEQALLDNVRAFMLALGNAKPATFKGNYMISAALSSTMGKGGVPLDMAYVDPTSPKFMRLEVE